MSPTFGQRLAYLTPGPDGRSWLESSHPLTLPRASVTQRLQKGLMSVVIDLVHQRE
jgi:hypothetical protein